MHEVKTPHFKEGERAILGGLLIDPSKRREVCELISLEDFHIDRYRIIFSALMVLEEKETPADLELLTQELIRQGKFEAAGGTEEIVELIDAIPTAANIMHYVKIVKEKTTRRKIMAMTAELTAMCQSPSVDLFTLLDQTERLALSAVEVGGKDDGVSRNILTPQSVLLAETLDAGFKATEEGSPGVPSGFKALDYYTTGFHPANYIVICGRTSMGKTSFALSIAQAAAQRCPVVFFSLEMSNVQLGRRTIAREGAINLRHLIKGDLNQETMNRFVKLVGDLENLPIFYNSVPTLSPTQIRFRLKSLYARKKVKPGLVIVDYLQLMNPGRRIDSREQQVSTISRELKQIAVEFECPIIALAQLSREVEKRPDKRPRLSDLRESGAIEQDADLVIGLYRHEVYSDKDEDRGKGEAIVLKNRDGEQGTVHLEWVPHTASYWNKKQEAF